jgi:glycosyltransferase involved in cell wall biosynthesis
MVPDYLGSKGRWRRLAAAAACRCFGEITCVNTRILRSIEALGIPQNRLRVEEAFLGVKHEKSDLAPSIEEWLRRHRPIIAATGLPSPEYGIPLLIGAVRRLASQHQDVGLVAIGLGTGVGGSYSSLEGVMMPGDIPHQQCLTLISRADVFVRPTFADGDSISVREALALGVPVIASDCVSRPADAVLFKSGNEDDLIAKIKCVLQESLQDCVR